MLPLYLQLFITCISILCEMRRKPAKLSTQIPSKTESYNTDSFPSKPWKFTDLTYKKYKNIPSYSKAPCSKLEPKSLHFQTGRGSNSKGILILRSPEMPRFVSRQKANVPMFDKQKYFKKKKNKPQRR